MVVNCEQVWREISNYLEGEVSPDLRAAMEAHFHDCKHCTAVLDGTRNVIHLYGDDRFAATACRLYRGLAKQVHGIYAQPRGTALGWLLAVAAIALVSGSFALLELTPGPLPRFVRSWPNREMEFLEG